MDGTRTSQSAAKGAQNHRRALKRTLFVHDEAVSGEIGGIILCCGGKLGGFNFSVPIPPGIRRGFLSISALGALPHTHSKIKSPKFPEKMKSCTTFAPAKAIFSKHPQVFQTPLCIRRAQCTY